MGQKRKVFVEILVAKDTIESLQIQLNDTQEKLNNIEESQREHSTIKQILNKVDYLPFGGEIFYCKSLHCNFHCNLEENLKKHLSEEHPTFTFVCGLCVSKNLVSTFDDCVSVLLHSFDQHKGEFNLQYLEDKKKKKKLLKKISFLVSQPTQFEQQIEIKEN